MKTTMRSITISLIVMIYVRCSVESVQRGVITFNGGRVNDGSNDYKILLVIGDKLVVGAKNHVYEINLDNLEEEKYIEWYPSTLDQQRCNALYTASICHNDIRVLVKNENNDLLICGTNALKPSCRIYRDEGGYYQKISEQQNAVGECPISPLSNSTSVYASNNKLYSAGTADRDNKDFLIYQRPVRTRQFDSQLLNEASFVSSFEMDDKVYFLFREVAVEYINCGKRVYSRIARVCKNDKGGPTEVMQNEFTSFFKTRMNCSIPGEYPFYFDEIQSATEVGLGNYKPSVSVSGAKDIFYAVFTTPPNSISGSAVCAYKMEDVRAAFADTFKDRADSDSMWRALPYEDIPQPHPAQCSGNTTELAFLRTKFIRGHSLMEKAVPAFGGRPIVIQSNINSKFTQIAVDFQVEAADNKYYDVLFIGTDDGRVMKAINKGTGDNVETVIIEDINVFDVPVINLKVHRRGTRTYVIATSSNDIKQFPAYNCATLNTCSKCVAAQDPYCSWISNSCQHSTDGLQDLNTGYHANCPIETDPDTTSGVPEQPVTGQAPVPTCAPCAPCKCLVAPEASQSPPPTPGNGKNEFQVGATTEKSDKNITDTKPGNLGASTSASYIYSAASMAIATVVSIVVSLFIGFLVGYKVSACKKGQDPESPYIDRSPGRNKMDAHLNHNDTFVNSNSSNNKPLNMVVNLTKPKSNTNLSNTETKPVQKVKKVYI